MNKTTILFSMAITLAALAGCGDNTSSAAPSPSAEQIAATQAAEQFKSTAAFTLNCRGNYSLATDGKTDTGTQSFSISVSPKQGVVHLFDFDVDGYVDRTHRGMNNEVRKISRVTDEIVEIGSFELNRRTGKYKYGITTAGLCSKAPVTIPIPEAKF